MKYLFKQTEEIGKKIHEADEIFLFLDYDGTLVPIKLRPELAVLPKWTRELLMNLVRSPKIYVTVVTGRQLKDIKKLIGINYPQRVDESPRSHSEPLSSSGVSPEQPLSHSKGTERPKNLIYVGNHGFEIKYAGKYWVHPEAARLKPMIKKMSSALNHSTKAIPGILVENKGLIASLHYRQVVGKSAREMRKIVSTAMSPYSRMFSIGRGKKVYEIRPRVEWDKGKAVLKVSELLGTNRRTLVSGLDKSSPYQVHTLKIYVGDDLTDEDAFRVLSKDDISVLVGHRKDSEAQYFCKSPTEVHRFLETL